MSMPQSTRTTQPFRVLLSCLGLLKGQGTGARPNTLLCTDCSLPGVSPRRATQSAHPGLLPDLSESPISNALQWRLQYGRANKLSAEGRTEGLENILG